MPIKERKNANNSDKISKKILIKEKDKEKTTFSFNHAKFYFKRIYEYGYTNYKNFSFKTIANMTRILELQRSFSTKNKKVKSNSPFKLSNSVVADSS